MIFLVASALLFGTGDIYTSYPVYGDKDPSFYANSRVNTVKDKGIVRELIVQCTQDSEGILLHDVVNDVFVDSKDTSHKSLSSAISGTCRAQ